MIEIRPVAELNIDDLYRLVTGYTSRAKYRISKRESDKQFSLSLALIPLAQPYLKRYDHLDKESVENYRQIAALGFSFGAYAGGQCVGIALAEPHRWNGSLWVWELHVAESHRRRGVGRQLIETLAEKAREVGLRTVVCETQNTNVPAIQFYHSVGFRIEGVDLSYYSNEDFPDGEIALFMKRRVMG